MKFLHLKDNDVFLIDYSGKISFYEGISNMILIEKEIRKISLNTDCLKLIFDLRNTVWENMQTHNALSAIARKSFDPYNFNFVIYIAILNNEYNAATFENEHWFIEKEDAIKWLAQKTQF